MTPKLQRRQAERLETARLQRRVDFKAMLQTPEGKRWFYGTLDSVCGTFGGSYVGGGIEAARASDYNEGRRSVGIDLMREAQDIAPLEYRAMVSERIATENAEAETRRSEAVPGAGEGSST